jgi:hypothetical protein
MSQSIGTQKPRNPARFLRFNTPILPEGHGFRSHCNRPHAGRRLSPAVGGACSEAANPVWR